MKQQRSSLAWPSLLLILIGGALNASGSGNLSGRVTATDGITPVVDYEVTAWRKSGSLWFGTRQNTSASGTFSFVALQNGTYRIEFAPDLDSGAYAQETYDDSPLLSTGTDIVITNGANFTNINAKLAAASAISGSVFGPGGTSGIGDINVMAHRRDGAFGWRRMGDFVYSNLDGSYRLGGLSGGSYRLEFHDSEGNYIDEVYNNAVDLDAGSDIVVPASSTVSGINVTLAQAGKVSGHVYASNGISPVANGYVSASHWSGTYWDPAGDLGSLDASGFYTIGGLSSGVYRIEFKVYDKAMLDEVYDNAIELDFGRDVAVVAGTTVSNIDAIIDQPAWPPRMIRVSPGEFMFSACYTSTGDAVCVLQGAESLTTSWVDFHTNNYVWKGVNEAMVFDVNGPISSRFWRVQSR